MKKGYSLLNSQLKDPIERTIKIRNENALFFEKSIEDLEYILHCAKNGLIKYKKKENSNTEEDCISNQAHATDDGPTLPHKKPGRRAKKKDPQEAQVTSESSDGGSLNDSCSSSRSRRAAAQAADHKMAQVKSFIKATKLRRPTDFEEKNRCGGKTVSSPPAKSRRTYQKQTASSNSPSEVDQNNDVENLPPFNHNISTKECNVCMERISTPTFNVFTRNRTKSNLLDGISAKRKSEDLFNDSIPLSEVANKMKDEATEDFEENNPQVEGRKINSNLQCTLTKNNGNKKKLKTKNNPDSGISSNGEEMQQIKLGNSPVVDSSMIPVNSSLSEEEFNGFEFNYKKTATVKKHNVTAIGKEYTEVNKNVKTEIKQNIDGNQEVEIVEVEISSAKTRRTKVLRKNENKITNNIDVEQNENEQFVEVNNKSPNIRSRTKTIRKVNSQDQEANDVKVLNNCVDDKNEVLSEICEDESNTRSRTKTIKKGVIMDENEDINLKYLASEFKDSVEVLKHDKKIVTETPKSPAPKGEFIKKRVEDFEKMVHAVEQDDEKRPGRITRNAAKNITASQSAKQTRNNAPSKTITPAEKAYLTPLATNNRMTPNCDSNTRFLVVNKGLNSGSHHTPIENNSTALVQKKAGEEAERKKKEGERIKRQAKEEDAKKKKEKVLKATAQETRRKREEKLQKVAAAREAAEREKAQLAAKAEKEKEEKMRQIAAEKQKEKEEQHKKKLVLQQQKNLEFEERRKQEEVARLAKLKELEDEHKRILAVKEREQQELLQKQQKTAELRLIEAEKAKHQGAKLGKLAPINNAKIKLQQGMTSSEKNCGQPPSQSYDITPAREDRPLLKPKTENDYGIDDARSEDSSDEECHPKKQIPLWAQSKNRERLLKVTSYVPKAIWDMFMQTNPHPDVNKMFAGKPIKKRIRTSSAVWGTPPV